MAYKKYIKKNGKIYGPYIYHSKRVDGKVVTEYKGTSKFNFSKIKDSKKLLPFLGVFIALIVLIFAGYVFLNSENGSLTGFSVLNLNANYQPGENLKGSLDLIVNEGELIPASSKIVFTFQNQTKEFALQDLLSEEELVQGNFYVQGNNLNGEGIGYGLEGETFVNPRVYFVLLISENLENDTTIEKEISESVSKGENFIYNLNENESVEIKPLSVTSNGERISDSLVSLSIENRTAILTTNYSVLEKGFGEDYFGNETKKMTFDLSEFNLSLNQGNLEISLEYLGNNLESLNTNFEEVATQDQTPNEELSSVSQNIELTEEERLILEREFGNTGLNATKAILNNGFIRVRYQIGNYWVEHSYSQDLSNETLNRFMKEDRIKWLKDLAKEVSSYDIQEENLEEFTGQYNF